MTAGEKIEIQASPRTQGKSVARAARLKKKIPAVCYGPKVDNRYFTIPLVDAERYSAQEYENTIFVLKSEDKKLNGLQVLKKDMSFNPITRLPIHFDFYALDMTQLVRVNVEIRYDGTSKGEKDGGVFSAIRRDIEVECMPSDIPSYFEVDITNLELDDTLHVSDLKIPEGIKLMTEEELTICRVAEVKEEVPEPEETAEAAAEGESEAPAAGDGEGEAEGESKAEGSEEASENKE